MRKELIDYNFPQDLKLMSLKDMEFLAVEIREFLIENISKTGGHLASNLGIVELTLALHYIFQTPKDKIIWDVGHQAYVHKILTGRANQFNTLRQMDGLSGFPKVIEDPSDCYNTGHASTSISALAGMAEARDIKGDDFSAIAVIGDGSLTGGLAYEGLNNLGASKSKAIVILNDNNMSIDEPTGGLSNHLGKLRVSRRYYDFKKKLGDTVDSIPLIGKKLRLGMSKARDSLKYILVDGIMFEELGFTYLGPIDGHNIEGLIENLRLAQAADGPVLLHILTKKGNGYLNAEKNPNKFHGTGPFDPTTGALLSQSTKTTYSEIFGKKLAQLAQKDQRIVAVSAAMVSGTGLEDFQSQFPERTFDVGIAEAHGVTFASGLATQGLKPVVCMYSTFLQRAYDQIVIDACLQNLPVVFAIDRAGAVGADGETHHGIFDISFLSHVPNLTILAPRDGDELCQMLEYSLSLNGPCAIRYPRGTDEQLGYDLLPLTDGYQILEKGTKAQIWPVGSMVSKGQAICKSLKSQGYDIGLVDPRVIKPLDHEKLLEITQGVEHLVTLEDNVISGGFGQTVSAALSNTPVKTYNIGWPDAFIEQGSIPQLFEKYKMDEKSLTERIREIIEG